MIVGTFSAALVALTIFMAALRQQILGRRRKCCRIRKRRPHARGAAVEFPVEVAPVDLREIGYVITAHRAPSPRSSKCKSRRGSRARSTKFPSPKAPTSRKDKCLPPSKAIATKSRSIRRRPQVAQSQRVRSTGRSAARTTRRCQRRASRAHHRRRHRDLPNQRRRPPRPTLSAAQEGIVKVAQLNLARFVS